MSMPENPAERFGNLAREDLERLLVDAEKALQAETDSDTQRLLHDLQLHQIELEIANRELLTAQATLEDSREQFATLFDLAPVAYLRLDHGGRIIQCNLSAARLFRRTRSALTNQLLSTLLRDTSPSRVLTHIQNAFASGGTATETFPFRPKGSEDEEARTLLFETSGLTWSDGSASCLVTATDITAVRVAERKLRESNERLSSLIAASPIGIGVVRDRVFQYVSPRFAELLGYAERELLGRNARMIYPSEGEYERVGRIKYAQLAVGRVGAVETVMRQRNGRLIDVLLSSAALDPSDLQAGFVFTALDITERNRNARALEETRRMLDRALSGGNIGTYSAELPVGAIDGDARFLQMLGYRPGDLTMDRDAWLSMIHPDDRPAVEARTAPMLAGQVDVFEAEYRVRHQRGHWKWVLDRARVYRREPDGVGVRVAGTILDISQRRSAEQKAGYLAEHDDLTELLNRRGMLHTLERLQAQMDRSGRPYAIAILDLDHFKAVNDGYGHPTGDVVLQQIGATLQAAVRTADAICRWGGEEFLVAMPDTTEATALTVVERLRAEVDERPIKTEGSSIHMTLSAGMAVSDKVGQDVYAVIRRADEALYLAKRLGRNRTEFKGSDEGQEAIAIATAFRIAEREQALDICSRPIFELTGGMQVGEELRARVPNPEGGIIEAGSAIGDVAAQLGIMPHIDRRMIEAAAVRLQGNDATADDRRPDRVFVRVSPELLRRQAVVRELAERLPDLSAAGPGLGLILTIDGSQRDRDCEGLVDRLEPLLERGCGIAIDDYCGNAANHRLLTRVPKSYVILDPGLVDLSTRSVRDYSILSGTLRTIHDLGCVSIARDVGDEAMQGHLAKLGVDWGMGEIVCTPGAWSAAGKAVDANRPGHGAWAF